MHISVAQSLCTATELGSWHSSHQPPVALTSTQCKVLDAASRDQIAALRSLQVLMGTNRSRVSATLPFYFTRRFLDAPLLPRHEAVVPAYAAATAGTFGSRNVQAEGGSGASSGDGSGGSATASSCAAEDVPIMHGLRHSARAMKQGESSMGFV